MLQNFGFSKQIRILRFGQWTRFIFSSMAQDVGCGSLQRPRILFFYTIQDEKALDTLGQ
jgi:hypothetical protein